MQQPNENSQIPDQPFEVQARELILRLRQRVQNVLDTLPAKVHNAATLSSSLNLQFGLSYKFWRFLVDEDVFVAGQQIPGKPGFRLFLDASQIAGVPEQLIIAARDTAEQFEATVRELSGDRSTFDIMLAAQAQHGDPKAELNQRRAAFRANGYILGVHCKTVFARYIIKPSEHDPDMFDIVGTHGYYELKRLRPDAPWRISRGARIGKQGQLQAKLHPKPLFPQNENELVGDLPILHDYCSQSLPGFQRIETESGRIAYHLDHSKVGSAGTLTCVIGEIFTKSYRRHTQGERTKASFGLPFRTPAEHAVIELLVDKNSTQYGDVTSTIFTDLYETGPGTTRDNHDILPVHDVVQCLGQTDSAETCKPVSQYKKLTDETFQTLGWNQSDFLTYRLQLRYPPIPATGFLKLPLAPSDE